MKVLCLYNHREYCMPMVRSAPHFDAHGITMTVVRGLSEKVALRELQNEYDVLLWQTPPVYESVIDCGLPVILLERVDGAQLRLSREWLPRVAGVIKSYLFRDREMYNTVTDRAHIAALHDAGIQCKRPLYREGRPQPQLCAGDLDKLRVGYSGFGGHDIMKEIVSQPVDFSAERELDVSFIGTVDYEGTEVETHRRAALEAARTWHGNYAGVPGRTVPRADYHKTLRHSKAVLCPWGWGEASYRDYEAMALGAVMIKPDSGYVESWSEIYLPSRKCIMCGPDFADAHQWIRFVVDGWQELEPLRRRARQAAVDAWNPVLIAQHMAKQIRSLL